MGTGGSMQRKRIVCRCAQCEVGGGGVQHEDLPPSPAPRCPLPANAHLKLQHNARDLVPRQQDEGEASQRIPARLQRLAGNCTTTNNILLGGYQGREGGQGVSRKGGRPRAVRAGATGSTEEHWAVAPPIATILSVVKSWSFSAARMKVSKLPLPCKSERPL